ncbi:MAG: hypothetical protein R6X35_04080 [Candidatus Krumholzibacteriia bacterium]
MSGAAPAGAEQTIRDLGDAVRALERRVAALEHRAPAAAATLDPAPAVAAALPRPADRPVFAATQAPALLGRSLLVLAGAFLLRALTERGVLPPAAGFALGLAYALLLTVLSLRAGGRGDHLGANVHGVTALLVAFPFVWETTAVRGLVSPAGGGAALACLTAAGLAVAWRRRLRFQYWSYTLAALATLLALSVATGAALFYGWLLLGLGATTVLFSYNRGWYLARWPVALAADLVILRLAVMTSNPGGATARGAPLPAGGIQALCLALLAVYLGLFAYRALVQGRGVRAFDVVQSLLVIAVGYGGAAYASRHGAGGTALLGWAGFALALAGYGVAFTVVRQRHGRGRAFFYFASLALLFLVLGSGLVVAGQTLAWVWIGLGLACAFLGGRYDRSTLRAHSAVYLGLAALQTGLVAATLDAFVGDPARVWRGLGTSALVALAATGACYVLLVRGAAAPDTRARRAPRFAVAVLTLMGLGYVAVTLLAHLVTASPPAASPAAVAVVRTGVLAVTAVTLAVVGRRPRLAELGWLVHPLLVLGLAKLVFEDLGRGNPVALTVGFGLFGGALIMAPRLLRGARRGA